MLGRISQRWEARSGCAMARREALQGDPAAVARVRAAQLGRHPVGHRPSTPAILLESWAGECLPSLPLLLKRLVGILGCPVALLQFVQRRVWLRGYMCGPLPTVYGR